jgi:serine/threonine protein kinase
LAKLKTFAQLHNVNVAPYIDSYVNEADQSLCAITGYMKGIHYHITSHHISGTTLAARLEEESKKQSPLPEAMVRRWLKQLIQGTNWLHDTGMTHRDLHPANVYFDSAGRLLISDLGCSKALFDKLRPGLTGVSCRCSPEWLAGEEDELKSDVWAIGCLAYEMCCFKALPVSFTLVPVDEQQSGVPASDDADHQPVTDPRDIQSGATDPHRPDAVLESEDPADDQCPSDLALPRRLVPRSRHRTSHESPAAPSRQG